MPWYALSIWSGAEARVAERLGNCYYPRRKIRARARNRKKLQSPYEYRALIPGYLFVNSEISRLIKWHEVPEVFGWVSVDGKALVVTDNEISYLKNQEELGNYDQTTQRFHELMLGRKYLIHDGILRGQTVIVQGIKHDTLMVSSTTSAIPFKISVADFRRMEHTCVG
jgi:transcription antitermination factor NusG